MFGDLFAPFNNDPLARLKRGGVAGYPDKSGNSPKTASQLVKEATAFYDKREYALAAKLFQEAVAKGATDRDTIYNTMAPT